MRRSIDLLAALVALVALSCAPGCTPGNGDSGSSTTSAPPTSGSSTTSAPPTSGSSTTSAPSMPAPIWSDEFNQGESLDPAWRVHDDTYGSGGHILSGNSPDAVTTHDGVLELTNSRTPTHGLPFQGAIITTRETGTYFPRYGRFEARMKLPGGQGAWPAFWLRHRNGAGVAEVDVMEWFYAMRPGATTATLHLDGHPNVSKRDVPFDPSEWHTWGVEIRPEGTGVRFTFSIDGVGYHSYLDTVHAWTSSAPADATWDVAVDAWVGGSWVGSPDGPLGVLGNGTKVPAAGLHLTSLPATTLVDWVRVWA